MRLGRRLGTLLGAAVLVAGGLATAPGATAGGGDDPIKCYNGPCPSPGPSPTAGSSGSGGAGNLGASLYVIQITHHGSAGSDGSSSTDFAAYAPQPCGYAPFLSGPALYALVSALEAIVGAFSGTFTAPSGDVAKYKTATDGFWYATTCNQLAGESNEDYLAAKKTFQTNNPALAWVSTTTTPPVPAIPSHELALADANSLPYPPLSIKRSPATKAVVGLPTWFWVDRADATVLKVRSEEQGGAQLYWSETTARLSGLHLSVDGMPGLDKDCKGAGTPYSPNAHSDCTIEFPATGAGYRVHVAATWTVSHTGWDLNGAVETLAPHETDQASTVEVDEIDSVNVTG